MEKFETASLLTSEGLVHLTRQLITCESVTPHEGGALLLLQEVLSGLGCEVFPLVFEGDGGPITHNLFAKWGRGSPHFCFAGHTDVVPAGDVRRWMHPPFSGAVEDGYVWGRGAVDMKGAIASFVCAFARFVESANPDHVSISFMITGDEEATGINGTPKIITWLEARGEKPDFCLVGEPTSCTHLGDHVKIGRRGSLNGVLQVFGTQGHVAFPSKADNPVPRLLDTLLALSQGPQEKASALFEPTRLEITSVDVGNPTVNLIPGSASARFNIRFSDQQSHTSLEEWLRQTCARLGGQHTLDLQLSGVAEAMEPGPLTDMLVAATKECLDLTPQLTTRGATSDARFIRHMCPVLELGLFEHTMHQINERVALADLETLTRLYEGILTRYFSSHVDGRVFIQT
ncbi:MAG: succinyl-diaminopimelate desuccinylase [Proteobacteria bacterium]|nr:succinyl-diaminopimelate desuccinylase [Pseudomonadota bacterium]